MTPERINEIFGGVRELIEWYKTINMCKVARQNGKTRFITDFTKNIGILNAALNSAEKCNICSMQGTRVCAECVRGCETDYFSPINGQCDECAKLGTLGENLVFHFEGEDEKIMLCHKCHIKIHERSTGQ